MSAVSGELLRQPRQQHVWYGLAATAWFLVPFPSGVTVVVTPHVCVCVCLAKDADVNVVHVMCMCVTRLLYSELHGVRSAVHGV